MIDLIAPTAPEGVTSLLFDQLVDSGWICLEAHGLKHWAEKKGLLCGAKVPPEVFTVLDRGPLVYNSQFSACQKCVSKLVHREFALPFRVGQRVISQACGMVLRGKIVRFFLFDDNTPALDITREWARPPEPISVRGHDVFENDIYPHDWYRAAHECKPLEEHPMPTVSLKATKGRSPTLSPAVLDVLRAATPSQDGLSLTLAGELDRATYQASAKAIEALGGKWNRKAGAHLFTDDVRPVLAGILGGDRLPDRNPLDFYPTPAPVITEMLKRIWPWPQGSRFLEPSAGDGAIVDQLWGKHSVYADCVELDEKRAQAIREKGYPLVGRDFLAFTPETPYDYVLMNPPFTSPGDTQAYIAHIEHALTCLRPGGDLVAVVPQGYAHGSRKRVSEFRAFCEAHSQSPTHTFAPDAFKASGTGVATCLIHITKPEEAAMPQTAEQPSKARKSKKEKTTEAAPASADTSTQGLVESATCPETGSTYSVGDWVSYSIKGVDMTGQVLTLKIQAPPFQPVASVPNKKTGQAWTVELRELQSAQAPEADSPFPVTEADIDAAITGTPTPELTPVDVVAQTDGYTPRPGDDVRVRSGRPDVAVITSLKDGEAQVLYSDGSRPWTPITALVKAHTAEQPEFQEAASANEVEPAPASILSGTLGLHSVPLAQLVRSGCNVRRHYDPAAIEELAASLQAEGQIENATGRWDAQGRIEIVAGESRRRAQVLREEAGETGLTLLVNVRELTDGEALAISATENMRRRSMTGLEECEAMMRLQDAGRTVEDLAAMFGYKSLQPVADRVLVARNLHTAGRDALDSGELSLAKAFVIARAIGQDLQKTMLQEAHYRSAKDLSGHLTRGQFLVSRAGFNVEKSGLSVKRDLFDTYEAFFEDKGKALDAQLAHARMLAERRVQKGGWEFVEVDAFKGWWSANDHKRYDGEASTGGGLVITVNLETGELKERENVKLRAAAKAATSPNGTPTPVEREMPASAHDAAHVYRARALRHQLLGDSHRTLVLTVHALIVGTSGSTGRAAVRPSDAWQAHEITDEAVARIQTWQATLGAALGTTPTLVNQSGEVFHDAAQGLRLYDYLFTLETPELLNLLNVVVASRLYEPHYTESKRPAAPLYARLAGEVDAHAYLAETFTLTDEWLKRYPRHELVALAEEAGLGRALVEDAKTQKEMRARILEHAERLHIEGFVPRLVRFPEGGKA